MPKKSLKLFVVTHTETYYNRRRIFTGQLNSTLTKRGHIQAERLAERLKNQKLGLAFISPLKRSGQTLGHILRHHTLGHFLKYHPGVEIHVDPRLAERDYGKLAHKSKIKYRREHPDLYLLYHRSYEVAPPGGESMVKVEKRVLRSLRKIMALMKKKRQNALIVAHNNSIRPIRRFFEKLTPQEMMRGDNYNKIFRYRIAL